MLGRMEGRHRITLGADKNYDTAAFVAALREMGVTPHVAQNNTNRRSAIDGRTTRHPGYGLSQKIRKRIEEVFGWAKTCGTMRKTNAAEPGPSLPLGHGYILIFLVFLPYA